MMSHRDARSAFRLSVFAASMGMACASPIAQSDSFTVAVRSSQDVVAGPTLGRREFAGFAGQTLAEALTRLRPDWLRTSPSILGSDENGRALVYTDDIASGDLRALQSIPADAAVRVQFLSASAATSRYGPACRCPGVIRVQTQRGE